MPLIFKILATCVVLGILIGVSSTQFEGKLGDVLDRIGKFATFGSLMGLGLTCIWSI